MTTELETRCQETGKPEFEERAEGSSGAGKIAGYAAMFNTLSQDLGGFKERIAPNAFSDVLEQDVRAVFNHDPSLIVGRSTSGTLRLSVDGTGLAYEVDLPNTTLGRDLAELVKRGDISQSSFRFKVLKQSWSIGEDGGEIRTIEQVGQLVDVSPVTYAAYIDATVAKRSFDETKICNKELVALKFAHMKKSQA